MDVNQIWNDLDLGGLLQGNLPLYKDPALAKDPMIKHDKRWLKPSYAVLKGRYDSLPTEPKYMPKSKIGKLADPVYGKYVGNKINKLEEVVAMAQEPDIDIYNYNYGNGQSSRSPSHSPSKGAGGAGSGGGFFLTEAAVSDEENRVTDKEINSFIKRRLNEAGRFAQKDNGLNDSKLKNKEGIKKKVRSKFEPSGKDVSKNKRAKQASMNSLQKGRNPLSEVKSSGLLPGGGRVSSVTKKRKKAKESAAAGAPSKLDESMTRGRKKTPLDIIKEERAAQVAKKRAQGLERVNVRQAGAALDKASAARSKLETCPVDYGANADRNKDAPLGRPAQGVGAVNGMAHGANGDSSILRSSSARDLGRRKLAPLPSRINNNNNNNSSSSNVGINSRNIPNNNSNSNVDEDAEKLASIISLAKAPRQSIGAVRGPGASGGRSGLLQASAGRGRSNVRSAPSLQTASLLAGLEKVSESERRDWHSKNNISLSKRPEGEISPNRGGYSPRSGSKSGKSPNINNQEGPPDSPMSKSSNVSNKSEKSSPVNRNLFKEGPGGMALPSSYSDSDDKDVNEPPAPSDSVERASSASLKEMNKPSETVARPNMRSTEDLINSLKSVESRDKLMGNRHDFKDDMKIANQLAGRIKNIGDKLNAAQISNEGYRRLVEGLE